MWLKSVVSSHSILPVIKNNSNEDSQLITIFFKSTFELIIIRNTAVWHIFRFQLISFQKFGNFATSTPIKTAQND